MPARWEEEAGAILIIYILPDDEKKRVPSLCNH